MVAEKVAVIVVARLVRPICQQGTGQRREREALLLRQRRQESRRGEGVTTVFVGARQEGQPFVEGPRVAVQVGEDRKRDSHGHMRLRHARARVNMPVPGGHIPRRHHHHRLKVLRRVVVAGVRRVHHRGLVVARGAEGLGKEVDN